MTNIQTVIRRVLVALFWILIPATAFAQQAFGIYPTTMTNTGVSGIWILANSSYAGMRAQGSAETTVGIRAAFRHLVVGATCTKAKEAGPKSAISRTHFTPARSITSLLTTFAEPRGPVVHFGTDCLIP